MQAYELRYVFWLPYVTNIEIIEIYKKNIHIQNQDSPAMRRRVRGILMSGRQFSLDSRMDLAIQGIEPIKVNNGAVQAIDESDENVCQEGTKAR